ncbi:MAG: cytochrome c oxidase, subunit, partial [Streptosporangiaceae bacterium]|nr:cytochrome c oxidase, subunit [Streptosporangiaceae bacterium]
MTATTQAAVAPAAGARTSKGRLIVSWMTSTDHKVIGYLYLITSFMFFLIGGIMALIMRAELWKPGLQVTSNEQFNQLFTMHG